MAEKHRHDAHHGDAEHRDAHHHHHHNHTGDFDWEAMAAELERSAELHAPALTQAAGWLRGLLTSAGDRPAAGVARILDVGSGPGAVTCLLADAFPDAEAIAVDGAAGLLDRARARAEKQGIGDRVRTQQADLPDDFAALPDADLIWTSHAVHHLGDQQAALNALAGKLRPGGVLAVLEGGLPLRFVPRDIGIGRPGLQSRLDAAVDEGFATMRAELPGARDTVEDWPAMLAASGLVPTGTRTFLTDLPAPLDLAAREQLHTHLTRLRDRFADRLAPEDRDALDQLVDGDAPTGILWRPDAFYLTATTVHTARACATR